MERMTIDELLEHSPTYLLAKMNGLIIYAKSLEKMLKMDQKTKDLQKDYDELMNDFHMERQNYLRLYKQAMDFKCPHCKLTGINTTIKL